MNNELLEQAVDLCLRAHRGQTDKGGQPYFLHPFRVMIAVAPDPELMVVALLHDVVEDFHAYDVDYIRNEFGDRIGDAVDAITRRKRDGQNEPHEEYWRRCKANELARKVKIADCNDNRDPKRLGQLSASEQSRLMKKYGRALTVMLNA